MKAALPEDVVGVFLLPPSLPDLEARLRGRGQDNEVEIARRMAVAREEITHWAEFDHVVVNRDFDATVAQVRAILHAARSERRRQPGLAGFIAGLLAG
jgi:guanylate kinase